MAEAKLIVKAVAADHDGINSAAIQHHQWSPYVVNGGTVMAVAGKDFVVVAGDTRMSSGYNITSRYVPKLHELTNQCVLASAGMQADAITLRKVLTARLTQYRQKHGRDVTAHSIAQLLSNTLYHKRFFPYYTFNTLAGVDAEGKGAVWGYDAIGSYERVPYVVNGSGSALITSILDNQVGKKTQRWTAEDPEPLPLEEIIDLVKDCFTAAGERDIYTGDKVNICVITKEGTKWETFDLKAD